MHRPLRTTLALMAAGALVVTTAMMSSPTSSGATDPDPSTYCTTLSDDLSGIYGILKTIDLNGPMEPAIPVLAQAVGQAVTMFEFMQADATTPAAVLSQLQDQIDFWSHVQTVLTTGTTEEQTTLFQDIDSMTAAFTALTDIVDAATAVCALPSDSPSESVSVSPSQSVTVSQSASSSPTQSVTVSQSVPVSSSASPSSSPSSSASQSAIQLSTGDFTVDSARKKTPVTVSVAPGDWKAASDSKKWLKVKKGAGKVGGAFIISTTKNKGPQRVGRVTVTSGSDSLTLTVTQNGTATVSIDPKTTTVEATASEVVIKVTTTPESAYVVKSKAKWITVGKQEATQVTLTIAENKGRQHKGKVLVQVGSRVETIVITQKAA